MYSSSYQPSTSFGAFPPVIKNLLILNGLFFLFALVPTTNELLVRWLGLWALGDLPDAVRTPYGIRLLGDFMPWQLVTYGFLHGGLGHIFFNMLALWLFGVAIERTWGSRRFAIYYFTCLIGAGLIQLAVISIWGPTYVPTIGASGAVYGILLAFGMMFPETEIYLYFLFPIKAKYFVIGYGLIELWSGLTSTNSGIAHFAHLGGMVVGLLLIYYWRGKLPIKPGRTSYA
jgi:membrane associated rhomboid family serine protease